MNTLNVFWDQTLVGRLEQAGRRGMSFQYAESYLSGDHPGPISLSLPLQKEAFTGDLARAWFANLLPEGDMRGQVARKLGVSERNDYALLDGLGGDCAGALRLLPESVTQAGEGKLVPLPWEELEEKIASAVRPSLLALVLQDGELRLSLAGAQDKLPVHYRDGKLALPGGNAASTHLLKVAGGGFPDLVPNELFCLTLARRVGLNVPAAELAPTPTPVLLVERYDRQIDAQGTIHRLHQEDFCQALGLPPETKYQNEGGPSLTDMFGVIARGSRSPLPDKRDLLNWVIFNFIIGNADAHAKNASLLFGRLGEHAVPRLAPFYDLVCTAVYGQLSDKLAQKIGGEYRPRFVQTRHWDRFAEAIGIKDKYLRQVAAELCDKVEAEAEPLAGNIAGAGPHAETLTGILQVIRNRVGRLRTAPE